MTQKEPPSDNLTVGAVNLPQCVILTLNERAYFKHICIAVRSFLPRKTKTVIHGSVWHKKGGSKDKKSHKADA